MKQLVTLGCSLSPKDSWPHVCNHAGLFDIHTNYGFGGGGNQQLLDCIDEYLLRNTVKDLTVIYQMTGMERGGGMYPITGPLPDVPKIQVHESWEAHSIRPDHRSCEWNGYFGNQHMLWSDKHDIVKNEHKNPIIMVTRVVSKLCLLANAGATVYAFRGWTGVIPHTPEETWKQITDVFDKNNVNYVDEPLVDWCIKTNQQFYPDDWHPATMSSRRYAEEFLSKQLASDA
tara:strand:- start:1337 stop:2026 length:690 start_codon:yes stop_codon:yes gene_type:complete